MPEVHFIGSLVGASDFSANSLYMRYELLSGDKWKLLDGKTQGQTQLGVTQGYYDSLVLWSHPIDIYYTTTSLIGWPRLNIEVIKQDSFGRNIQCGYGTIQMPVQSGPNALECVVWKPRGSLSDRLHEHFLDTANHLEHPDIVYSSGDRFELSTVSEGSVYLELDVVTRGFKNNGVALREQLWEQEMDQSL